VRVSVVAEQLLAPVPGGTGRYTSELVAGLIRTAGPDDLVTTWVAWHRDAERARIRGSSGPRRLPLPRRALAEAWALGAGPAPGGELVHAPTLLVPPRRSRPLVVTIHDAVPWTHPQTLTARGVRWHRRMAAIAARHADAVTVPTEAVGDELTHALPQLSASRIHVLGAGVTRALVDDPSAQRRADVRRRLDLPERYVITLATLEPRKGLDVLVSALAAMGEGAPPLLAVGQLGWGGVELDSVARDAGLPAGAARALGHVDDADLAVVLREAEALVAPSRAEGFGLPLIEAMAVGTPVICSDIPAFREVAADAALLVPVGDPGALAAAMGRLTGDAGLRARLVAAGLSRAAGFDWDRVARRAWQLYRDLAG
jgi:glycosyltransferase involved in cell wall biosynthesis